MTTTLSLTSLITNNRITSTFSDEFLPKFARYGELYVVAGVLYISGIEDLILKEIRDEKKGKLMLDTLIKKVGE